MKGSTVANVQRVDDVRDAEGFIIEGGYSFWACTSCKFEVRRYRGQSDVDCPSCGACYNASGQRLRDNWRDNRSNWDDEVSDMDGYEESALRRDAAIDGMY